MARIRNGILGGYRGKLGNTIGQVYRGVEVVRVMPQSVANPKTPEQVAHRKIISFLARIYQSVNPLLKYTIEDRSFMGNSFNRELSFNYKRAVVDGKILFDDLTFGLYYGQPLDDLAINFSVTNAELGISLRWLSVVNDVNKFEDDQVCVVVLCDHYDKEPSVLYASPLPVTRGKDGEAAEYELVIEDYNLITVDDTIHLYVGCYSPGCKLSANTTITIAAHNIPTYPDTKPSLISRWDAFRNSLIHQAQYP